MQTQLAVQCATLEHTHPPHTHLCHEEPEVHLAVLDLAVELKVVVLAPQLANGNVLVAARAASALVVVVAARAARGRTAGLKRGRLLHLCVCVCVCWQAGRGGEGVEGWSTQQMSGHVR